MAMCLPDGVQEASVHHDADIRTIAAVSYSVDGVAVVSLT